MLQLYEDNEPESAKFIRKVLTALQFYSFTVLQFYSYTALTTSETQRPTPSSSTTYLPFLRRFLALVV